MIVFLLSRIALYKYVMLCYVRFELHVTHKLMQYLLTLKSL